MRKEPDRRGFEDRRAGLSGLLATKLQIPPARPDLVPRERLIRLLSQPEPRKLALISAPAGFGKTTLVATWAPVSQNTVAWVSLDEGDNDPARFWAYFVAALPNLSPGQREELLQDLHAVSLGHAEEFLASLINAIASLPTEFALVLDDYHLIREESIHRAMNYLLDHQPAQMLLVIASREDPPLSLAKLRARGQLLELRAQDLRFTPEEASHFLNRTMGLQLPTEDVAALEARTEGWIAGLQLAALSLQARQDVPSFIEAFSGSQRHVLDYLAEEVFYRQPEDTREFLLRTSILDRLSAPLCDFVTGDRAKELRLETQDSSLITHHPSLAGPRPLFPVPRSLEMLARLEKENLFLVPMDEEREWYRYHHLFAEFLRGLLARTHGELVSGLHRRASEWLEDHDYPEEALEHALAAADHARAARLIEIMAEEVIKRGGLASLARWLRRLPEEYVRPNPRLCLAHAWALLGAGDFTGAEARLADAERGLKDMAEPQAVASGIAALRSFIAIIRGDVAGAVTFSQQALAEMPTGNSFLPSLVALTYGFANEVTGDTAAARRAYVEATASGRSAGNVIATVGALAQHGDLQVIRGQLRYAARLYRQALRTGTEEKGWSLLYAAAHVGLGRVLLEWNDLGEAQHHLTWGLDQLVNWGTMGVFGNVMLAMCRQAWGDLEGAAEALELAEQASGTLPPVIEEVLSAMEALLWLRRGETEKAVVWARQARWDPEEVPTSLTQYQSAALGRILVAEGRAEEALAVASSLAKKAEEGGWWGVVIDSLVVQVLALDRLGEREAALATLRRALSLGEPEGYVRTFVQEGEPMFSLLSRLRETLETGVSRAYLDRLLAAFPASYQSSVVSRQPSLAGPRPDLPRPLSSRELELLRLLADGLSTREIAAKLVIEEGTVKRHLHNIYGKLGVASRTQAIAAARKLGLLAD